MIEAALATTEARQRAASHVGDAIEALTDDHVRRHAEDPWADIWAGQVQGHAAVEEMFDRVDRAAKSLHVARIELLAACTPPVRWSGDAFGWSWMCHVCHGAGDTSHDLEEIAAYRRGHMRAVHAVEVD